MRLLRAMVKSQVEAAEARARSKLAARRQTITMVSCISSSAWAKSQP